MGDIKKVYKAYNGSKPNNKKIIDPVISVNSMAIIGTKKFIIFELCDLEIIIGKKLFIFTTH